MSRDKKKTETENKIDVRATLSQKGGPTTQRILTFITGKAGWETPLWRNTPSSTLIGQLLALLLGLLIAAHGWARLPDLFAQFTPAQLVWAGAEIIIGSILAAGGTRVANSVLLHHSTHSNFPVPKWFANWLNLVPSLGKAVKSPLGAWNVAIGEAISSVFLLTPHGLYDMFHKEHHKGDKLATLKDPDFQFLKSMGFGTGQPLWQYWARLWFALVNPWFHGQMVWSRLSAGILDARTPLARRILGALVLIALITLFAFTGAFGFALMIAYGTSVLWLANWNALLQLLSEHQWGRLPDSDNKRVRLERKTHARYLAPKLPRRDTPLDWAWWWFKLITISLPVRLFVLGGDLGSHPLHHIFARSADWANSAYEVRRLLAEGWDEFREDWGLANQLGKVFELLSSLPPTPGSIGPGEVNDEMRGM